MFFFNKKSGTNKELRKLRSCTQNGRKVLENPGFY